MALTPQEIAATQYFDEDAYVEAKAQMMYRNGKTGSVEDAKAQFLSKWTGDMIDHYLQYGAAENVNPSNNFDNSDYIQQVAVAEGLTYQEVKADLESQGMTPLAHFLDIGEAEGYTAPAVSEDEQVIVDPPVENMTFTLTADSDRGSDFEGGDGDDIYDAPIVQNAFAGGVSNSLSSAADLDGGAGTDTLNAVLVSEFVGATTGYNIDVQPTTTNIEDINIEALDYSYNGVVAPAARNTVTLDAKHMTDIVEIGSSYSDGDLIIENLTTLDSNGNIRLTKDMTITMDHTDNFNSDNDASDLTVYFDEDYLNVTTDTTGSSLTLKINNVLNIKEGNNPVENFNEINFSVGTTAVTVDVEGSTSYAEIRDKINAELTDMGLTNVSASLDAAENVYFSQLTTTDTNTYPANSFAGTFNPITITNTGSELLVKGLIELNQGQVDGDINNTWDPTQPTEITNPISINVELDKAGRDGEGGDLIIGGKDLDIDGDTDVDKNDGIQIFDVTVKGDEDRPSHLGIMASTNAELNTINIVSEDRTDDSYAALTVSGNLTGLDYDNTSDNSPFGADLTTFDADGFKGDLAIGTESPALNIDDFNAAGGGDVTLVHNTTVDGVFTVDTGAGKDSITTDIDMSDSAIHTYSNTINTGSNDDTVDLTYSNQTVTNFINTVQIDQININTGDGDDVVTIGSNDGIFSTANVDLGAGNDTVIISNDAATAKAQWVFNADAAGASYVGRGDVAHNVFQLKVAVEFEGVTTDFVKVSYDTTTYTTSATAINDAIKEAIVNDDEMSQLLRATDLRDNGLQVDSLVDRVFDADDLNVVFLAPKYQEFIDNAAGDSDSVLEQDDSALYQNDSAEIFAARETITAAEMANAHNAWFLNSSGVDGDITTNDVSNSVIGDIIYDGDTGQNETALYNSMFRAVDSDDVNSSSQSGEVNADPADDDNDNGANLLAGTVVDQNMNYDLANGYNKINTATGANNTEVSITEITGGAGNDLLVLNSNNTAASGFETIVLTEDFGTDTVLNFHTANATATEDVIDYSVFLDAAARDRAESADAKNNRVDQKVAFEFYNTVDNENANAVANNGATDDNEITGGALVVAGEGIIDHNTVITIELSDLFDELQTTGVGGETVANYSEITDAMISRALNVIIDDNDFQLADDDGNTAGLVTESGLAGGEVVFNVVYDRQIEESTVNSTEYVLGDDTDYHTMAVYSATIAHNGEVDADAAEANDLSLTNVEKQGVLDFGDLFSDLADLTDDSMLGTADQSAAADAELHSFVDYGDEEDTAPVVEAQTFSVDENSEAGTVVGTVIATDAEDDTLIYGLAGTTDFAINSETGEITVAADADLDYETTATYDLSVTVIEEADPTFFDTAVVTININDIDENLPTEVDLKNGDVLDADADNFQFNAELGATDIFSANIANFTGDDAINIDDAYLGAENLLFDTTGNTEINFAFGDMTDYTPSFTLNLTEVDATLVESVELAGTSDAALDILNVAWGTDWLI